MLQERDAFAALSEPKKRYLRQRGDLNVDFITEVLRKINHVPLPAQAPQPPQENNAPAQ
jgi:hypothetical protein